MNRWGIPDWLEKKIRDRDKLCVYCHIELKEYLDIKGTPKDKATFEHLTDEDLPLEDNVVMCCGSCNSSRGAKELPDWLESLYCKKKKISRETINPIVWELLRKQKRGLIKKQ